MTDCSYFKVIDGDLYDTIQDIERWNRMKKPFALIALYSDDVEPK